MSSQMPSNQIKSNQIYLFINNIKYIHIPTNLQNNYNGRKQQIDYNRKQKKLKKKKGRKKNSNNFSY